MKPYKYHKSRYLLTYLLGMMEREIRTYPWEIHYNEVKILKKIGEGSFGTVFKGKS